MTERTEEPTIMLVPCALQPGRKNGGHQYLVVCVCQSDAKQFSIDVGEKISAPNCDFTDVDC